MNGGEKMKQHKFVQQDTKEILIIKVSNGKCINVKGQPTFNRMYDMLVLNGYTRMLE